MMTLTTESKIKALEYISMLCIIPMFYFIAFGGLMGIIITGCIGLVFQVPIYMLYKSINQQGAYLKNKAMTLAIAGLLVIYLIVEHKF